MRDGAPVEGARVHVDLDASYEIRTVADGTFDTHDILPAPRVYAVDALDPATGREAFATVFVAPGGTTEVTLPLLASTGGLAIHVLQASGAPAPRAELDVRRGGRPVRNYQTFASADGILTLTNVLEGDYSATACFAPGQTRLCTTRRISVAPGVVTTSTIVLGGTGTVAGRYVEADGVTPVGFAQVAVGGVGFTTTSSAGNYLLAGVPLGTHPVSATNAVTGRGARGTARLTREGQLATVDLREDALGEVVGRVVDQDGVTPVPGANVRFTTSNTLFPPLAVSTDPTGRFQIPGVPEGPFSMIASVPWTPPVSGTVDASMPPTLGQLVQDVLFTAAGTIEVTVVDPSGAPARARVALSGVAGTIDTSTTGRAVFTRVRLGAAIVAAESLDAGNTWSAARADVALTRRGELLPVTITLPGVVRASGVVVDAAGLPVPGAEVTLVTDDPLAGTQLQRTPSRLALTAADGTFDFTDVPVGTLRLRAIWGALAAQREEVATTGGQVLAGLELRLGPSARVHGLARRADGVSPYAFGEITIEHPTASGLPGSARTFTDATGAFEFSGIPSAIPGNPGDPGNSELGRFTLHALLPSPQDGVLRVDGTIPASATDVDLGVVRFDEAAPVIVSVTPVDGAEGVDVDAIVELELSEAMDPDHANAAGVYVAAGDTVVPATLAWDCAPTTGCTRLRLVRAAPLASQTPYALVAIAGDLRLLEGSAEARGLRDLAGRPLALPFISTFTTEDAEPPRIVELTPADGGEQLAVDTVVRVVTSEPVDPASVELALFDRAGNAVPGATSVGLGDRVITFVSSTNLAPNETYRATLAAVRDRAGNPAVGLPVIHTFRTLDTIGPTLTALAPVGVRALVRGISARFEATLAEPEVGVMLQLSERPPALVAASMPGDLGVSLALTRTGTITLFARGVDRFGNVGPWLERTFAIAENQPPSIALTTSRLRTGDVYELRVDADDDSAVAAIDVELSGLRTEAFTQAGGAPIVFTGVVARDQGPATLTLRAEAEDNAGATSGVTERTLVAEDGVEPTLVVTTGGTEVSPGDVVTLHVAGADAFGLARLVIVHGRDPSASIDEVLAGAPGTVERDHPFPIPSDAAPFERISAIIELTDVSGLMTWRVVEYLVRDVIPPVIAYSSPADGATNVSLSSPIEIVFTEPVTGVSTANVQLFADGAPVAATPRIVGEHLMIEAGPLAPGALHTIVLGSGITDLSGNALTPVTLTFTTGNPDTTPPRLLSVIPDDDATGILPPEYVDYLFDEALLASTVTSSIVTLAAEADGIAVPVDVSLLEGVRVRARPRSPLAFGTSYALTLYPTATDVAGNAIAGPDGRPFTTHETRFTTARLGVLTSGTGRVVEGQRVAVTLDYELATEPIETEALVNGVEVASVLGRAPAWTITVPSLGGAATGTVTLGARVFVTSRRWLDATPRALAVEPAMGDWDQDGMPNGAEAQAGTDPWTSDASADPDGDGLDNATELALGTNPNDADSDDDGASDLVDGAPLSGNRRPGVGLRGRERGVTFDGTATRFVELPATNLAAPFTLELWAFPSAAGTILAGTTPDTLRVAFPTATSFEVGLATAGEGWSSHTAAVPSVLAQWHHVAVTYDGQYLRGYLDGTLIISHARSGAVENPPGNSLRVGMNFRGIVDEVRRFGIARTAQALQSTMHRTLDATEPGLVGRWAFDETSGTTAADATGTSGAATVSSASAWAVSSAPVFEAGARTLVGAEAELELRSYDLDTRSAAPAVRITALPAHGALYATSDPRDPPERGTRITTAPFVMSTRVVVYVADAGWHGPDGFTIETSDGVTTALPAHVELVPATLRTFVGLDAAAPTAWSSASNWAPPGVPVTGENIELPAGLPGPVVLAANADVASLTIAAGAVLELQGPSQAGRTLTVRGHVMNAGAIQGTGTVILSGPPGTFAGNYPGLRVTRDLALDGPVEVAGNLLAVGRRLALGAHTLHVAGDLEAYRAPELAHASAVLDVDGDATFGCPDYLGLPSTMILSHGTVRVAGDFTARACGYSPTWSPSFVATDALTVVLDGAAVQNVSLANAAPGIAALRHLVVATPAGAVLTERTLVLGSLTVTSGGAVRGAGPLAVLGAAVVEAGGSVDVDSLEPRGTWSVAPGGTAHTALLRATSEAELSFTGVAYDRLAVAADVMLTAPIAISGDLELASGSLALLGHAATIGGDLIVTSGALLMAEPADLLVVGGDVRVEATPFWTPSTLTAGTLRVGGDFLLATTDGTFFPSGTHRTIFDGAAPASIDVSQALTYFRTLELRAPSVMITGVAGLQVWDLVVASPLDVAVGTSVEVTNALTLEAPGGVISNAGTLGAYYCSPYPIPTTVNPVTCGGPLP
ncbi:Ig-like domain-containing protein [Myxococcota bacterium]|nr:Ig-like domain-containing protein [Myxococcota bacterium]